MIPLLNNISPDFKKLLSGSGLVMAFKVAGAGAGYIFAYLITTNYGAESFGIFELSLTALTIASLFARLGLGGALVRFISEFIEKGADVHLRKVYRLALFISLPFSIFLGVLLYLYAYELAMLFGNEALTTPFRIVAHIIPFATSYQINAEAYRGMKEMTGYSILQRGTVIIIAIAVFFMLQFQDYETHLIPLFSFGTGVVLLSIFAAFTTPRTLSKQVVAKTTFKTDEIAIKPLLKVAFPMLISTSMFMIMNWTDTLMIGYYLDESEVGIYRLAFKVATLITFAQFAINSIAAPMFSSFSAKNDLASLRKMTLNIGYMNLIISTPIFIAILIFPSFVLDFFGEEFTTGVAPLIILAIGQIINAICGPVMYLLNMTGKEKQARNIIIVASIINIALNLYLIPIYGLMGAAIATGVSTVVWNIMAVFQIKKEYGFISIPHPF